MENYVAVVAAADEGFEVFAGARSVLGVEFEGYGSLGWGLEGEMKGRVGKEKSRE